jgi:hypothetical protein
VLRHRLVLSYEALAEGLTADADQQGDEEVPPPDKPLEHASARGRPAWNCRFIRKGAPAP